MTRLLGLLLLLPPLATAAADSATPLPDPLSLEQALELAGEAAPPLRRAAALRDRESALAARSAADDDLEILLQGRLRLIETPDVAPDDDRDDHWAGLFVRKRLYDFGRSDALDAAGRAQAESGEWGYLEARRAHRLLVLESFFDVLLADLAHAWRNEALAIAFIRADRSRDRRQLGQLSDLEVLEAESANAEALRRFAQAEAHQRATRQRLASALGRPHELPANLARPALRWNEQPRPNDERGLVELALGGNPRLQAQRARLAAAEARLGAAQLVGRPTLSGEVELSEYSRESATRDPLRAGVYVELPLFRGGRDRAEQAARAAEVEQLRAELDGDEQALQQEILETWQALRVLQLQRSAARRELEFRELYLDRSRAQYEMELRADLGDAMVEFSGARLRAAEADFRLALAWERLDALTNGALGEQIKERDGDERKR